MRAFNRPRPDSSRLSVTVSATLKKIAKCPSSIDFKSFNGCSPLHYASANGNFEVSSSALAYKLESFVFVPNLTALVAALRSA